MNPIYKVKKYICVRIGLFLTWLYSFFRECSEVTYKSQKRLKEYKESEQECNNIKAKLPLVKIGVDELLQSNDELKELLDIVIKDMKLIKYYFEIGEYEIVRNILANYEVKNIEG